jgi:endonuclease III related protein
VTKDKRLSAQRIYRLLSDAYGPQHWWPGDTPLEVVVGAVLTQNTAWHNVALAVTNLKNAGLLEVEALIDAPVEQIKAAIRPSGFYNVKYVRLMNLLNHISAQGGLEAMATRPMDNVRAGLLDVPGIGRETADCVLLYALNMPSFVVDNYTRRLFSRLGHAWTTSADYDALRAWFVASLPQGVPLYSEYHALIDMHGKTRCRKRPLCESCPMVRYCHWEDEQTETATSALQP